MNIAFVTNSKLVRYLPVIFSSLRENHMGVNITIYVMHSALNNNDLNLLEEYAEKFELKLVFLLVDRLEYEDFEQGYIPAETYFRLSLPFLLPDDIERVLSLDTDIIVDGNLLELYNMDFEENAIIATPILSCQDSTFDAHKHKLLGVTPATGLYFNGGVMVLNLPLIRKNVCFEDYVNFAKTESYENCDQGIWNHFFWDKVLYVQTYKYNFYPIATNTPPKEKPTIIHYSGGYIKPWGLHVENDAYDQITGKKILFSGYNMMVRDDGVLPQKASYQFQLTSEENKYIGIWWRYAKLCMPLYEELYREMQIRNEVFYFHIKPAFNYIKHTEKYLDVYKKLFLPENSHKLAEYMEPFNHVAIYGYSNLGQSLSERLKTLNICAEIIFDREFSSARTDGGVLYTPAISDLSTADLVIVTALMDFDSISANLSDKITAKIISLNELLTTLSSM